MRQILQVNSLMFLAVGKTIVAAVLISFVSWLSGRQTSLAGFLTALPLTTLLALAFSQMEWQNAEQSVDYAKSVFAAVPVTLLFFVPFLFAKKFEIGFWQCYLMGCVFLLIGYFAFSNIVKIFT